MFYALKVFIVTKFMIRKYLIENSVNNGSVLLVGLKIASRKARPFHRFVLILVQERKSLANPTKKNVIVTQK